MRAAVSEAICIDSLLPVLRHLLGVYEAQKGLLEGSNSSLAMREVGVLSCFYMFHGLCTASVI